MFVSESVERKDKEKVTKFKDFDAELEFNKRKSRFGQSTGSKLISDRGRRIMARGKSNCRTNFDRNLERTESLCDYRGSRYFPFLIYSN